MSVKGTAYKLLRRLSNILGYNIIITLRSYATDTPYKTDLQDGLMSQHSNDFILDEKFIKAYGRGTKAAKGICNIQWRLHVALWAAHTCSRIEGDYVECGVADGFTSSAIMEYLNWNELNKE